MSKFWLEINKKICIDPKKAGISKREDQAVNQKCRDLALGILGYPVAEFKEFEPRFKSAKTRFKLSAGLNLETFDTILSGTNHI